MLAYLFSESDISNFGLLSPDEHLVLLRQSMFLVLGKW